jgi:Sec-independent protein translocase protein TatA
MNRIVAIAAVLTLSAIMFMGCDDKVKQNGEAMTAATKEFVKSALDNAADTAKAKATEAADAAKEKASEAAAAVKQTAKEKAVEAAEAVAKELKE